MLNRNLKDASMIAIIMGYVLMEIAFVGAII
jgi:hypothetical protein